ncbi:PKD domain-containing protein [Lentzea sp. NPDC092896]|uniref:PKD domain-containing protein n=1 Tax=Lentzea sp. NPDC092896 TaxID=3364127 RepID=UPI003804B5A2
MRRTKALTALAAAAVTAGAVLLAGQGYDAARVHMVAGAIWLTSVQTGQATLVDGASAEVKASVRVARPGTAFDVVQHDGAGYALNAGTGQLSRVDSATEEVSSPVSVLPASDGLTGKAAPGVLYAVDVHSGTVASADARTLAPQGEPLILAESLKPDSVFVDGGGRLWAIDAGSGELVWLAAGERRRSSVSFGNGHLAITEGRPAVVDTARGTVDLIDPGTGAVTRSLRVPLHENDVVAVSGSADRSRVLIANSTRGELVTCAFDAGGCADPVEIGAEGADLGPPAEIGNHAVVPDRSTGTATIVDLAGTRVVAQRELFAQPARFELLTHDGIVFFNDPAGDGAGVLDLDGEVRTIVKYTEQGASEGDAPPAPEPRAQANQVTKIDSRKQQPIAGLPGRQGRTSLTTPRPPAPPTPPAASIVVSPAGRATVGDELDLRMVLRPEGAAAVRWSLGDGTEPTGASVRHRWQRPGVFTVRAEATLGNGTAVHAETAVTVDPVQAPPTIAHLSVQRPKPVIGESVRFSADTGGKPDSWAWTVTRPGAAAPEITARTPEFDHRFASPGVYTVSLRITSGTLSAESSRQLTVARGAVKGWGYNWGGQLNVPQAALSGVVEMDAGLNHGLALKADGSVVAWGYNGYQQLNVPSEALSGVVAIAAGGNHNMALKNGGVIAWGSNILEQLHVPLQAKKDVVAIAAGHDFSLALKSDGSVITWGVDVWRLTPLPLSVLSGVTAIAAGGRHAMAMRTDGSIVVWGETNLGEANVPSEAKSGVATIAAGFMSSYAWKADGTLIAWGDDKWGQVTLPAEARSGVVAFDADFAHGLALKADGRVIAWGHSAFGESVVPPEYSSGVLAVAAGERFSLVLV